MSKKIKENLITPMVEKVMFEFAYEENARNVAIALSFGGFYVNVVKSSGSYLVRVYTNRI